MRTSSRSVAIVLFDEVEILDVAGPVSVWTTAGRNWNFRPFKLFTVSSVPGLVATRNQLPLNAGPLDDCPAPEVVVVPGGYGARRALTDDRLIAWLRAVSASATRLVGIGNGVLPFAKAGVLDGLDVSVRGDVEERLAELAPTARADGDSRFREAGKALTAATPLGAMDAALHLVEVFLGKKQAESVASTLGMTRPRGGPGIRIVE